MMAKPPSAAELATALTDHSTALIKTLRVNSTALAENSTALIKSLRVKVLDSAELVKSLRVKVQDTAALLKSLKKGERLALVAVGSAAAATAVALLWRRRRRLPPPPPPAVALEDIAKYPGRAAVGVIDAPKSLAFAPGDAAVTYLASPPGSTSQKLYSLDLASGTVSELLADDRTDESTYTAEEKLRRERLRMLHTGVTEYSWSTEGGVMLVPQGSRSLVAIRTSLGGAPVALFDADAKGSPLPAGEPCLDARLSKDGAFCGFVCGGEVFVCSTTGTSAPVQVTHGAKAAGVTHGVASFVAQEEMDRMEGWWLSPDASLLAFEEVDERGVPTFTIPHHVPDPHASETHRYPFAGADNPRARLGIVKVRGRENQKVVWLKMPEQKHPGYICRVAWRDEKQLFVQTQSRRQDEVRLLAVDAASGRECGVGVPSSGTNRRDESVRRSRQCSLYPPPPVGAGSVELRQTFYDAVGALRDELQACEELALPELADFETELIYLLYPVGGHYMRHLDVPRAGDGWVPKGRRATDGGSLSGAATRRAISFILYLNPGWDAADGGHLRCWPAGERLSHLPPERQLTPHAEDVVCNGGTLVLLHSADVEHQVCETRAERQCIVGWFRELSEARIPDLDETSLRTLGSLDREGTADACAEQFEVLCEQEMRANNHPSVNLETLGALAPVETKPGPARDKRPALVGPKGVNSV